MSSEAHAAEQWTLEDVGAQLCARDGAQLEAACGWVYPVGADAVRVMWTEEEPDGTKRTRAKMVPSHVLAHVLRVQGYSVTDPSEARG